MSHWKVFNGFCTYFVTTTIVQWQNVFLDQDICRVLIDNLKYAVLNNGLEINGYVIMPNHFHAILFAASDGNLSDIMRDMKRITSRQITSNLEARSRNDLLSIFSRAAQRDRRGNRYQVWQEGFHSIVVESSWFFLQKLNYIHQNPVRKGLVTHPEDWPYSSARNYILQDHSVLPVSCLE